MKAPFEVTYRAWKYHVCLNDWDECDHEFSFNCTECRRLVHVRGADMAKAAEGGGLCHHCAVGHAQRRALGEWSPF